MFYNPLQQWIFVRRKLKIFSNNLHFICTFTKICFYGMFIIKYKSQTSKKRDSKILEENRVSPTLHNQLCHIYTLQWENCLHLAFFHIESWSTDSLLPISYTLTPPCQHVMVSPDGQVTLVEKHTCGTCVRPFSFLSSVYVSIPRLTSGWGPVLTAGIGIT